mgnify:CR=1 FL=1
MRRIVLFGLVIGLMTTTSWAELDCPPDSSYHVDMRTMLPDGSPNPTYGQEIATGLCACMGYVDGIEINGNEVTKLQMELLLKLQKQKMNKKK